MEALQSQSCANGDDNGCMLGEPKRLDVCGQPHTDFVAEVGNNAAYQGQTTISVSPYILSPPFSCTKFMHSLLIWQISENLSPSSPIHQEYTNNSHYDVLQPST